MGTHKDLQVWKLSVDFVVEVYKLTKKLPNEEKFGLISQIRRAAVSIPSNIAEGAGRKSNKEYIQFLYISLASLTELDTQLIIAKKLDYCNPDSHLETLEQIKSMLINLIKYLKEL